MVSLRSILPALAAAMMALASATASGVPPDATSRPFVQGQLLVAAPSMSDPRFTHAVIYMVNHDAKGAFGLIVNRPLGAGPLDKLLKGFGLPTGQARGDVTLRFGGPVQPDALYVLHSSDWQGKATFGVAGGLAVTASPEVLKAIADGGGPRRYLFIVGYAGWGPGQLEREMAREDWLSAPADVDLIFGGDDASKWDRATAEAGITL